MDTIFSLSTKLSKKNSIDSLVGFKNNKLIYIYIKKYIENKQVNFRLEESFEYCELLPNEKPIDALFKRGEVYSDTPESKKLFKLNLLDIIPGNYYPRIYRPILQERKGLILGSTNNKIEKLEEIVFNYPLFNPGKVSIIVSGVNQLTTLKSLLIEILNTVYPSVSNLKTYGHKIKNLLVLSCIEVEAQLKGVYKENELCSKRNYSTIDYIKLKESMKLHKYSVRLPLYPELQSFKPFKNWNLEKGPTKSLKWYNDYNEVKHNSETKFYRANLNSAISSLCAVVILLKAQYGNEIPYWKEEIGNYFEVTDNIEWSINEHLLPPFDNKWTLKKIEL